MAEPFLTAYGFDGHLVNQQNDQAHAESMETISNLIFASRAYTNWCNSLFER
jgi:endo-beta-N-acetylglucosaminidase D